MVQFYLVIFIHNFLLKNVKKIDSNYTCISFGFKLYLLFFFNFQTISELHNLNLKLCSKQYNKSDLLQLIVVPQLSGGWQHNYSTKTRQAGHANEQSLYSLMSMVKTFSIAALILMTLIMDLIIVGCVNGIK